MLVSVWFLHSVECELQRTAFRELFVCFHRVRQGDSSQTGPEQGPPQPDFHNTRTVKRGNCCIIPLQQSLISGIKDLTLLESVCSCS